MRNEPLLGLCKKSPIKFFWHKMQQASAQHHADKILHREVVGGSASVGGKKGGGGSYKTVRWL